MKQAEADQIVSAMAHGFARPENGWHFYSGLQSHEVHLGLCSGSVNAAATQKAPKGCTSLTCNLL
ncbi:hypothetical protein [Microseira wollei]|uniref:hypothetical protein n=1 Tax=Microseira wollei TaxID=467598 RepID=UPI001CFE35FE|nr:hypothetical protein [Microseira wollei]